MSATILGLHSVPALSEQVWCWYPLTISSIFLLIFLNCFSGTDAHPWSCKLQFFLPLSWWIHCTLVLKSFFFLFFFSCECMCTPICKLMWAYCSLHSGSAWGLGATWEGYVAWSNAHCFAARLTTKRLTGCCHSRMASGQLVQNKLISACKRLCIL